MKQNNLNAVRLFAAALVLYGHSFVFLGRSEPLFLSWAPLGPIGVFIFFIISGYLVSESWDRDPNLWRFLARRSLRIFPALVVCVVLSIFVLGPLLTTLPLKDYFLNPHTRRYLSNIGLYIVYYLPGVFETNRIANAVNGSIWSLPVEFLMYVVIAIVGVVVRGNRWILLMLAIASALVTLKWAWATNEMLVVYGTDMRQVFICGTYFWVGAIFYKFDLKRWFSLSGTVIAMLLLLCLEPWTQWLRIGAWILLPIVVLSFGLSYSPLLNLLTANRDYSYGIYIYAFPIQQTVVYLHPQIGVMEYLLLCIAITLIFAALSWHLVERKALAFKPKRRSTHDKTCVLQASPQGTTSSSI